MRRKLFIVLMLALVLAVPAQAQDDPASLGGEYALSGAYLDGSEPYTGTGTITGSGSLYTFAAQYEGDDEALADPLLLMGNVIIDAYGYEDTACGDTGYVRLDDGKLLGLWIDTLAGGGLGVEVLTPEGETTGFVGSYAIQGIYSDGTPYGGTVTISEGENGLYLLDYLFPADEKLDELVATGYGLVSGNILGVSLSLDPEADHENCGIYVAELADDGSFGGTWYEYGEFGTETAIPQ